MRSFARLREHPWLFVCIVALATIFSVGCTSSRSDSGATSNPLGAYDVNTPSNSGSNGTIVGDGNTVTPGSLSGPVIIVDDNVGSSIGGHDNAPLLTNDHAGWGQSDCLTCHNSTSNNPDHNYSDASLCYLCHGTNGLPGLSDTTPPVLSSVVVSPTSNSVTVSWKSDENCVSRLVLKTVAGDKMEFPVSSTYTTSHKYTVTGLQSSSTYYYELICTDKSGNKTSTSSFSSALMFQTSVAAPVAPVVPTNPDDPGGETSESEAFYQKFAYTDKGDGDFLISFEAHPRSEDKISKFQYFMFDENKKDLNISNDFDPTSNNVYTVEVNSRQKPGKYYVQIKVNFVNNRDSIKSRYYSMTLKK